MDFFKIQTLEVVDNNLFLPELLPKFWNLGGFGIGKGRVLETFGFLDGGGIWLFSFSSSDTKSTTPFSSPISSEIQE